MDRDSLDWLLRSVKEAKWHQSGFLQLLTKLIKYFKPRAKQPLSIILQCTLEHPNSSIVSVSLSDCSSTVESISVFDDDLTALSSDIDPGWLLLD